MENKNKTAFLVLPYTLSHNEAEACLRECSDKGYNIFCLLTSTLEGPIHQIENLRIIDKSDKVILYYRLQDITFTHKIDILRNSAYMKNNRITVETLCDGPLDLKNMKAKLSPSEKLYLKDTTKYASVLLYVDSEHSKNDNWIKLEKERLTDYCKSKSYHIADFFIFNFDNTTEMELQKFSLKESLSSDDIDCIVTPNRTGFHTIFDESFKDILLDYHCDIEFLDETDKCSTLLKEGSESVSDANFTARIIESAFTYMKKIFVVARLNKIDETISSSLLQKVSNSIKKAFEAQDLKVEGFVLVNSDGLTINDKSRIIRGITDTAVDYIYICQFPALSSHHKFTTKDIVTVIDIPEIVGEKKKYNDVLVAIDNELSSFTLWTPQIANSIISSDYDTLDTIKINIPNGVFNIPDLKIIIELQKASQRVAGEIEYSVFVESSITSARFLIYKGKEIESNIRCYTTEHFINLMANNKEAINEIFTFEEYLEFVSND